MDILFSEPGDTKVMASQKKVVIIGTGIGGLATANLLAKAGYSVSIYEKNERPGGRADQLKAKGFTFDMGPSWYLMPEVFEHYYELLGEDVNDLLDLERLSPAYKVFFEGDKSPVVITSDQAVDSQTFEAIETGAGKALEKYVKRGDDIYALSLKHFLYSNFQSISDLVKKDVLSRGITMLRLAFTPIDRYIGKFVTDIRLQQILEYPMVFLGTSPFTAPAIYSLMSALDFRQGVFYPHGGLYTIIESLVKLGKKLGVTYHFNQATTRIISTNGQATGIELEGGKVVTADIVISNADLHYTETQLVDEPDQTYPESYWKNMQAGPSALLMYLGVSGSLPNFEHHNLIFVDKWKENFEAIYGSKTAPTPASIYICKPSGIDASVAPEGAENLFVLVPFPPDRDLSDKEVTELTDQYLTQIARDTNTPDLKERIIFKQIFGPNDFSTKFHSWQNTALGPSHILRQSAIFRTPNVSKKLRNLYYVGGSTMPGIGLPMCLIGAELIYKRLSGSKRGGPEKTIEQIGQV